MSDEETKAKLQTGKQAADEIALEDAKRVQVETRAALLEYRDAVGQRESAEHGVRMTIEMLERLRAGHEDTLVAAKRREQDALVALVKAAGLPGDAEAVLLKAVELGRE